MAQRTQGRVCAPPLGQARRRRVKESNQGGAHQDRHREGSGHGNIGDDAPHKIVFAAPGGCCKHDADPNAKKAGESLADTLTLNETNDARDEGDGRGSDERGGERMRGNVDDDEDEAWSGRLDDTSRAAQGLGSGKLLRRRLAHPPRSRHQPSPAMTR